MSLPETKVTRILESNFSIDLTQPLSVISVSGTDELIGIKEEDFLVGKVTLQSRIHTDDQDIAEKLFSAETKPTSGTFNIRLRHADGHIICVKGQYFKAIDPASHNTSLQLLLQDAKSLWKTLNHETCEQSTATNFKAMMDNTDDYIYFKDRNHVFNGASQALVEVTPSTKHWTQFLGLTDYDVFLEEYADIYYSLEKRVFSGENIASEIQETLSQDGKKGWVSNRKYPIKNETGEIIGLFGIARDITESKLTEASLARSEVKFRTLFDNTHDAILMLDEKGFFDCNQAALDLFGIHSQSELRKYHPADLSPPKQSCGTDSTVLAKHYINTALQKGNAHFEWIHQRADSGAIFEADILLTSMTIDNKLMLQTTVRDITDHKKIEADLRIAAIAFNTQEGMLITDNNENILRINPAFTTITGYRAEDLIGCTPRVLSSGLHKKEFYRAMWDSVINKGFWQGELWNRRKDGELYIENLTITAVKNEAGLVTHYLSNFINITARKQAELKLAESEERFRTLVESANDIIYSHDLDGTLTYVSPNIQGILGYEPGDVVGKHFDALIHPDDLDAAISFTERTIKSECKNNDLEYRLLHADGSWRWHTTNEAPYRDAHGQLIGLLGITRDVTEHKEIEAHIL